MPDERERVTALDRLLLEPDVARLAAYVRTHPGQQTEPYEGSRFAAIALVVRAGGDGRPELLLIKRSEYEGDPWSGHIACPGGRMEPDDRDLAQTATRETWEETGIDLVRDGRILGTFDDVAPRTPALPPVIIRPYLAIVVADVTIVKSDEVADTFWVPFAALRQTSAWGMGAVLVRGVKREVPTFRHEPHVVWGLTERVLAQVVSVLHAGSRADPA